MSKGPKIIIWGFPLHSHTHSYIHASFYKAFSYLGYETYWFHDENFPDPSVFDYSNCLFISEEYAAGKIPLNKTSTYFIHNSIKPSKYLDIGSRLIDIRFNVKEINDINYSMVLDKEKLFKIDDATYYNCNADDSVLSDKWKKGVSGYEAIHMTWATDLLPHEFNFEDRFLKRDNKFYFVGTIGGSNSVEMQKVVNSLTELNISFIHINPWQNPCSNEENYQYLKKSIISLDVRGTDFYHTNSDGLLELNGKIVTGGNHKKIGFIACRTLKQISCGRFPGTNSKFAKELLGDYVLYDDNEGDLVYKMIDAEKNLDHDLIYDAMTHVQKNHTFINRVESILKVYNKEI
jgi:hypothetical protein